MTSRFRFTVLLVFLIVPAAVCAITPPVPDVTRDYVVDLANIIESETEAHLNGYLKELEEKTTAQVVILTIKSLEGFPIEEVSIDIAHNKWRLGQKGKDNGLLVLVSLDDRQYRIEVGYGLESVIPDSLAGTIGRQYLVPYFRQGNYSQGIYSAALALAGEIARSQNVQITGMPEYRPEGDFTFTVTGLSPAKLFFVLLFFILLFVLFIRHPWLLIFFLMSGRRRTGWGGYSGGGSGGFGGGGGSFGGGGGGGFGGGGASGRW